jgi:hypothetical protein
MKNTVDLDDLLNAPLVINPDDEIKENDVVITKGVVTDDDLLNAPLVIDSNTDEETNIKTDIPEEHEVKEEKEKNIPPSQDTLYSLYKEKYPQLFQNGQLVDFDAAEEIGIISPVSGVATDDEQVNGGHVSTRTKETPFGFMYNTEVESVEVQKENARNNQDFSRIERVAEDFDVPEMSAKEEDKFINDMIDAMPDKNPDGSVNLMKKFLGITGSTGYSIINALGKGVSYVGAGYQDIIEKVAKETQEAFPEQYNSIIKKSPKEFASEIGRGTMAGLEFSETVPVLGMVTKLPAANARIARKLANELAKNKKKAEKAWNRTLNVNKMKGATAQQIQEKKDAAKKVAEENKQISNQLIKEFEEKTGKTISTTDEAGNKKIDYNLARDVGNETAEDLVQSKGTTLFDKAKEEILGADISENAVLFGQGDTLFQPILKPDKFDGIVAVASDLKKANPQAFNNNKTIIDNLFDLTVNKKLIAGDELIDMLNKYDISFEDYVLTVVGSGSTAGKVLNKLSQIKRARPVNEMVAMQQAATIKNQDTIRNTIMRIENIRRGGLVSQIATAARNLTSAGIRAPLEGFGNVIDTALYNLSNEGVISGTKSLASINNWRDSFRHMKYMFNNPKETKEVVDFILERPELEGQYKLLFDNINEIMISTGRGKGGIVDKVLSEGEDAVMALNIPNRWQEFLVRRGAFLGELERLVKREYKIDFIDALNQGKIRDLLNDAGNVRPAGARSFIDLVADSTQKALDVTYAKQPDIPMFRNISSFIVRNGLTVVAPFPRFMFNSMELMGQYMGGASIPLTRKIASMVTFGKVGKGKLTPKDRQRISRNLIGGATMLAAYQYRSSEDAPPDFKKLRLDDNTEMDTTPQFPMRQFLYLGEAGRRLVEGTFEDFFDSKEFLETFVGTNLRTGVGESIFQDLADIISATDISSEEKAAKGLVAPVADYLASWFVPFAQIIETQRALGIRGLEYKDLREDPTLDALTTAKKEFEKPFKQRGFTVSPEEEEAAPKREFVFAEDKKRVSPISRVLLGLNLSTRDSEEGEYLARLGYKDFKFGSKSQVPTVQRAENKIIREALPLIVNFVRDEEDNLREEYRDAGPATKNDFTEQAYVNSGVKGLIDIQIRKLKEKIANEGLGKGQASEYARQLLSFRKLPKNIRRRAVTQFYDLNGKPPNVAEEDDLTELAIIGKKIKSIFRGN